MSFSIFKCPTNSFSKFFAAPEQDPESLRKIESPAQQNVRKGAIAVVNSTSTAAKLVTVGLALSIPALIITFLALDEENATRQWLGEKLESNILSLELSRFLEIPTLGLIAIGAKKIGVILNQQENLPKMAILIGKGMVYASAATFFLDTLTDIINIDIHLWQGTLPSLGMFIMFALIGFGMYHGVELLSGAQQSLITKLKPE